MEEEPDGDPSAGADRDEEADEVVSEEGLMGEFDGADDDAGALAVARRLQRPRRLGLLGGVCKEKGRRR